MDDATSSAPECALERNESVNSYLAEALLTEDLDDGRTIRGVTITNLFRPEPPGSGE